MSHSDRRNSNQGKTSRGSTDCLIIRPMNPGDIASGLMLSEKVGWNQLEADWRLFYRLNPGGAFVAQCDNKVVGTVTTTDYCGKMGWVAMVIVDPAFRQRGIATRLVKAAINVLSNIKTIKLDATPAGREVYSRMGFGDEFDLTRYTVAKSPGPELLTDKADICAMQDTDLNEVTELDGKVLGAKRPVVIEGLFNIAPEYAFVMKKNGKIKGFVMGRRGLNFEFVGPLIAADIEGAKALLHMALRQIKGQPMAIDVPDYASEWQKYLEKFGMSPQRPFTRMYLGEKPLSGNLKSMWAGGGPEIG